MGFLFWFATVLGMEPRALNILGRRCSSKQYPLPLPCRFLVCRIFSSNSLEENTQGGVARNWVLYPQELKAFMGTHKDIWGLPSSVEPAGNTSDSGANPSPEGGLWGGLEGSRGKNQLHLTF